ncbi:MAG: S1/P1 Nuclease [Betaproteobacteria bacterium]|nr:S1/P1 Nuclease [Betaproteobacteria bacterium]
MTNPLSLSPKQTLCGASPLRGKCIAGALLLWALAPAAHAWGDTGHEVVARIALHFLSPGARARVEALLADDPDPLTAHDPVSAAVWADRYRDSPENGRRANYQQTHAWHFVDLERWHPDLARACHGFPALPPGTPASRGPAADCVVDKIEQFNAELKPWPGPDARPERRAEAQRALKFLIHFVGDLHQPLHAIDDHDRGGNQKRVTLAGAHAGTLHHYWDDVFVQRLGPDDAAIAATLSARITPANVRAWQHGTPRDWARESFDTARTQAYDPLPAPDERGHYRLSPDYRDQATEIVALQLEEAGVRLAALLEGDAR